MKLIQLNMANGRLLPPLLRFLKAEQPDIICLQELEDTKAFPDQLQAIHEASGLEHVYFSPLAGYMIAGSFYEVGDATYSRYAIEQADTIPLHGAYDPDWRCLNANHNACRNLQSVCVTVDGTPYHIVNYYGYYVAGSKQGNDETMRIMDMICDYIETLDGPVIFASDTNLVPDSPSMARLNSILRNLCVEHDVKTTRNFVAKRLTPEVIDYICVSPDVAVRSFRVADEVVSDHQALILEI